MRGTGALIAALLLLAGNAGAEIYKYIDPDGVVTFSDVPVSGSVMLDRGLEPLGGKKPEPASKPTSKDAYETIVSNTAGKYKIDPELMHAVITAESNYNPDAVSHRGALGLMQLMPDTARILGVKNPFNPAQNIEGGAKYLRLLMDKFNGNLKLVLAAYNAGPNTVENYGGVPPYKETKDYVAKVMKLYGKGGTGAGAVRLPIYKLVLDDGTIVLTNVKPADKKTPTLRF